MIDILKDVEVLRKMILSSKEYKNYKIYLNKISKNEEINKLISKIKLLQKQIVKKETAKAETKHLEKELEKLYNDLFLIEDYSYYIKYSKVLNSLISNIQKNFENYFNSLIS